MAGLSELMSMMSQRSGGRGSNPQLSRLAQMFMQRRNSAPGGQPKMMRPGAMPPQSMRPGGAMGSAAVRPAGGPKGLGMGGDMGKRGGGLPDSASESSGGGNAFGGGLREAMAAARQAGSPMGQTAQDYIGAAKAAVPGFGPNPAQAAAASAVQGTQPGATGQVPTLPGGAMPAPGGQMEDVLKRLMEQMKSTGGGAAKPQGVPFGVMPPGGRVR